MPFTFSHPAIMLPLSATKWRLSMTGLIVGSMVPDFEYFFRFGGGESIGHQGIGILIFNFPMALLLSYLYHNVIRNAFVENLPLWYRSRLIAYTNFDWNQYVSQNKIRVVSSVLVGILSHFLWDSFTHQDGAAVMFIPGLNSSLNLFHNSIPIYSVLQIVSSVWGLWYVQRFMAKMPQTLKATTSDDVDPAYWLIIAFVSSCFIMIRLSLLPQQSAFWTVIFASLGALMLSWVMTSIIYNKLFILKWKEL